MYITLKTYHSEPNAPKRLNLAHGLNIRKIITDVVARPLVGILTIVLTLFLTLIHALE